jgi:hypothetical protein
MRRSQVRALLSDRRLLTPEQVRRSKGAHNANNVAFEKLKRDEAVRMLATALNELNAEYAPR